MVVTSCMASISAWALCYERGGPSKNTSVMRSRFPQARRLPTARPRVRPRPDGRSEPADGGGPVHQPRCPMFQRRRSWRRRVS